MPDPTQSRSSSSPSVLSCWHCGHSRLDSRSEARKTARHAVVEASVLQQGTIRSRNLVRRGSHAAFPLRNMERSTYRAGIPRSIPRCDTERKSLATFARSDKRRGTRYILFHFVRRNAHRLQVAGEIAYADTCFPPYITRQFRVGDVEGRIPLQSKTRQKFTSRFTVRERALAPFGISSTL